MIRSFASKKAEDLFNGRRVKAFHGFAARAEAKLQILDAATTLGDLAALPGNKFEAVKGDRAGEYSIRINDQYRICFAWKADGPHAVKSSITTEVQHAERNATDSAR